MNVSITTKEGIDTLWQQYYITKEVSYRDEIIVHYLILVKCVVGRLGTVLPGHVKLEDLYSSGVTGLIKAVEKFDPLRNSKFESYAILLIKGAIIDELRSLDWIPRSIHQKAHKISVAQETLQQKLGREPTHDELSEQLGISLEELEDLLWRVRPMVLVSLNGEVSLQEEESGSFLERIADERAQTSGDIAEKNEQAHLLECAIAHLPDQEQRVLMLYYYEDLMLKEIGKVLGVSESRVSQIHTKALLKLRSYLKPNLRP